jgi:hypothetical protein
MFETISELEIESAPVEENRSEPNLTGARLEQAVEVRTALPRRRRLRLRVSWCSDLTCRAGP